MQLPDVSQTPLPGQLPNSLSLPGRGFPSEFYRRERWPSAVRRNVQRQLHAAAMKELP